MVLVLCFVVLITGLVVALLSRSNSSGLISNASANFTRTDIYGQGAINQVIGDLRQEIADGSVTPPTAGYTDANGHATYLYRPVAATNAAPALVGPSSYGSPNSATSVWNATFPNLVKESLYNVPFYTYTSGSAANIPNRAAPVSTSTSGIDPNAISGLSRNERYVSLAEWNKALLLPKNSATIVTGAGGSATTLSENSPILDTTPNTAFVAPDWILTAADGTNPTAKTLDMSADLTKSNVNPQSTKYIIGRYAYTIYNEGGLLDANVAGSPAVASPTTLFKATGGAANSTFTQAAILSRKGPAAFADLTQLPGIAKVTNITPQKVVDQLVGWRNYATAQPANTFPGYTLTASINPYFSTLLGLNTRFMTIASTTAVAGQTDHRFTSRQQLITFLQDLVPSNDTADQAYLQDAMMYLGTFSRTLNQPSFWPDPARPKVGSAASDTNTGNYGDYGGGNSAFGDDNGYNPIFRSARVMATFHRPSETAYSAGTTTNPCPDGSVAVVGEPLVKKRFALSRLCWLTYKGPSATLSSNDALITLYLKDGVPQQLINEGTPANILAYFGLTWVGPTAGVGGFWVYNHGIMAGGAPMLGSLYDTTSPSNPRDVVTANREPDFFELLKASICAGSVAKAWVGNGSVEYNGAFYGQIQDSTVTPQIMQIGANIIDEANPTNYPTHIVYAFPSGVSNDYRSVYGAMDLPYLVSMTPVSIMVQQASPAPTNSDNPTAASAPIVSSNSGGMFSGPEGTGALLVVPTIWNPYDFNPLVAPVLPTLAPTNLRIVVAAAAPTLNASYPSSLPAGTAGTLQLQPRSYYAPVPPGADQINAAGISQQTTSYFSVPSPVWGTEDSSAVDFTNPMSSYSALSSIFREPTVLLQSGMPSGSGVTAGPSNAMAQNPYPWTTTGVPEQGSGTKFIGFFGGTFPLRWTHPSTQTTPPNPAIPAYYTYTANDIQLSEPNWTVRLEYSSGGTGGPWYPYMEYPGPRAATRPSPSPQVRRRC